MPMPSSPQISRQPAMDAKPQRPKQPNQHTKRKQAPKHPTAISQPQGQAKRKQPNQHTKGKLPNQRTKSKQPPQNTANRQTPDPQIKPKQPNQYTSNKARKHNRTGPGAKPPAKRRKQQAAAVQLAAPASQPGIHDLPVPPDEFLNQDEEAEFSSLAFLHGGMDDVHLPSQVLPFLGTWDT